MRDSSEACGVFLERRWGGDAEIMRTLPFAHALW